MTPTTISRALAEYLTDWLDRAAITKATPEDRGMDDVATIARGLSKAQREALLWCNVDGSPRAHLRGAETSFFCMAKVIRGNPEREIATMYSLVKRGQSEVKKRGLWPCSTWCLTPLGLRVRNHLGDTNG